jgi:tRNA (adenine58-N1)-methyltransferase non-catalytic subunit
MDQIEALKFVGGGSGKDLIAKLLESHSAIDQKTAFGLAKYTLRKEKKYLRRFTILPVDVSLLSRWIMTEKEPMKIMEMKEEMIALAGSWSNVHYTVPGKITTIGNGTGSSKGRWLVIDETSGLLVAAVAEKLGLLNIQQDEASTLPAASEADPEDQSPLVNGCSEPQYLTDGYLPRNVQEPTTSRKPAGLACANTITLIHANAQPNISLLRYFNFDASNPAPSHPLQSHLRTISWLQLLAPEDDNGYAEPEIVAAEVLQTWKSGKRGNYFRKRRRWERIKSIVDETREGNFDGLLVASVMNLDTILHHTVPLLRGAAQVVIYSPTVEPLAEVADLYSTARRAAFVMDPPDIGLLPSEDFPLNPTLLLAPSIQTARSRSWQVLPGRTHPLMTGRGGAEGYIFTATRVLPAEGKVAARGKFKRRKISDSNELGVSEGRTHTQDKKVKEI